jgi:predicted nuclease of restriction endonuclease-like RecB superfamily
MLRSEHVIARLSRGKLVPHRLSKEDPHALEVAEELCGLYAGHVGRPRARLEEDLAAREEELGPRLDARRGFRIVRGLAKLLEERSSWSSPTAADPYAVRTRVFELAAALPEPPAEDPGLLELPTRDDVLSRVAAETGIEDPAALMYADRQGAQILEAFEEPSPEELVARYNVAQVQGVLYAARELVVDLGEGADARLVFHYVKTQGLIYALEPTSEGYRLRLDGPLSIFGATRKYGLRLARFFPGLLLTSPWSLSATVEWRDRGTYLELDSETSGLESHYLGPRSEKEADPVREAFARAWNRAKDTGGWELEPGAGILSFPEKKAALVPDFTLRHADTGERVHLELLGFWSERNLVERASLLREAGERGYRVLVAASERLGTSPEALSEAIKGGVVPFKERLAPKAVLAALEASGKTEA